MEQEGATTSVPERPKLSSVERATLDVQAWPDEHQHWCESCGCPEEHLTIFLFPPREDCRPIALCARCHADYVRRTPPVEADEQDSDSWLAEFLEEVRFRID